MTRPDEHSVLAPVRFHGTLSLGDRSCPVDFMASAGADGRLVVELDEVPANFHFEVLSRVMGEPGSTAKLLTLDGVGGDKAAFHSSAVSIRGWTTGGEGNHVRLGALSARVSLRLPQKAGRPWMQLLFRGFKSFRPAPVQSDLGEVHVFGVHGKVDPDAISGGVAITAPSADVGPDWEQKADAFLTFLHRGLAFAHGGRLQVPRVDVIREDRWTSTFYEGIGRPRHLGVIPHLDQGPFIEALVRRYEREPPFPDPVWTAVGWLHSGTPVDEVQFLASMTALETIVEHLLPKELGAIVPKKEFARLRSSVVGSIERVEMSEVLRASIVSKVGGANQRSLLQKLIALREHCGLRNDLFPDAGLKTLRDLRNDIVHTGRASEERDVWGAIVFVRELVTRIVLAELGYEGHFDSYLGGHDLRRLTEDHGVSAPASPPSTP